MTSKAAPVWAKIPEDVKKDVIGELDFLSRGSLQRCSRLDHLITQNCALNLDLVHFRFVDNAFKSKPPMTRLIIKHGGIEKQVDFKCDKIKISIDNFLAIFKNSKVSTKVLYIEEHPEFMTRMMVALDSQPKTFKFRAETLKWGNPFENELYFFQIFQKCDPKVLRGIDCFIGNLSDGILREILDSELWKGLKMSCLHFKDHLDIEHLFHLEKFRTAKSLTNDEAEKVIENFRSRRLPRGSFFYIYSYSTLDVRKLCGIYSTPIRRSSFQIIIVSTVSEDLSLVVHLSDNGLSGVIGNPDMTYEEFDRCVLVKK